MVPPAPPTFSTTTVWPSGARMRSAMMRAVVSVEPPGGKGTISVTGRVGKALRLRDAGATATDDATLRCEFFHVIPP